MKIRLFKPALFWFLVTFFLRMGIGILTHIYSLQIGKGGFFPLASGHDDRAYWIQAISILNGYKPSHLKNPYPIVLAYLYHFTTPSLLLGKFLNILLASLSVWFGVLLIWELTKDSPKSLYEPLHPVNLVGFLLTFYPASVFYSTQLLKDSLILLFGILALYFSVLALKRKKIRYWILWGGSIACLFPFRPYAAIAIAFGLGIYFFIYWRASLSYKLIFFALFVLIFGLIPYVEGQGWFGYLYIKEYASLEVVENIRKTAYSHGGSAIGIVFSRKNPLHLLVSYLYSLLTVALGPFPWQGKSMNILLALPEAFLMWLLLPAWVRGIKTIFTRRRGEENLLLLESLSLMGTIALFSDNIGADTRLRLLPWSIFFIFASFVIDKKIKRRINFVT